MPGRTQEPIAIVGSACRFAGDAVSPSKLWELLHSPRDVRSEIPDSRFSADGFYHADHGHHGRSNVKHAYLINEDLGLFDAEFFGIKPIEAKAVDPQQRLLAEVVYEGLEAAGLPMEGLRGSDTAVYVGVMTNDYEALLLRDLQTAPTYLATGVGRSILSNRISYFFDWHGPSITIDTACSSSVVSVHMALQALRSGDSRVAVACGSNLIIGPENFVVESKLKMLSPDGVSRMWDRDANGYARGDGVAAVVLKTLSAAIEDGDHIEAVIRETGINQDGATRGITMPSATAQEALIRSTYSKAGLSIDSPADRPQFFEAHGTGTPAGDPIEAEAISKAFFSDTEGKTVQNQRLYVGSIKTILGHTEGTAGVAAILKASLALQHSCVPPNLLFDNLSESVAPFYKNLNIATTATPWPKVHNASQVRRASVNSFGFGGLNGHAIIESYNKPALEEPREAAGDLFSPFVFSAMSELSLRGILEQYSSFLKANDTVDIHDLAWTLRQRRSLLSYRAAFSAKSIEDLTSQIDARLQDTAIKVSVRALPTAEDFKPKLLGVFTGQGAQYARMGAELIEKSSLARRIVHELESHLAALPSKDQPTWSLKAELLADPSSSRVNQASLSQPLCTAVQIVLVDLLRQAGVEFDSVVGHSSGEIAAAYAAGFLTARDAIVVAYYRGLHLGSAASPNGKDIKGAMLAVGTSMEDAAQICDMEEFSDRIAVAACNSPSSVTISGDEDAIAELQAMLDDESKFNRRLRVDRAYHSAHMLPCFDSYVESLRISGVKAQIPAVQKCTWISSVYDKPVDSEAGLSGTYWAENMTKPVLFSQALSSAVPAASFHLAVEVGAHPALKGPALQTIQEATNSEIPYSGVLSRQTGAIEAFSAVLGFLWQYLGKHVVDLDKFETGVVDDGHVHKVVKGLPSYQWNHTNKYWHESRVSRKMRLRKNPVGNLSLLGDEAPESGLHQRTWKNLLRHKEMDWLSGHQVQGQIVFPAAGYVSTAIEAAKSLAGDRTISLIDIEDFVIHQAVAFEQDDAGIEVLISLGDIERPSPDRVRARFTYSAAMSSSSIDMDLAASGHIELHLSEASPEVLPERAPLPAHMIEVDTERFYASLANLGYDFSDRFRSLTTMRRVHHKSVCDVRMLPREPGDESMIVHPAELDAAFQSVILAYSYPDDDQLRSLHLPTQIGRIRLNPALCASIPRGEDQLVPADATITPMGFGNQGFSGDVSLFANGVSDAAIQVQAVKLVPVGGASVDDDRKVFSRLDWLSRLPNGVSAAVDTNLTQYERDVLDALERISVYYLAEFDRVLPDNHALRSEAPTKYYLDYARHIISLVGSGKHRWAKKEWLNHTLEDVLAVTDKYSDLVDIRMMHLVGKTMPRVFKGETTVLEEFRTSNLLDEYYETGFGLQQSSMWIARAVSQLTDLYPHMNMLEIGAGTGGATKNIFRTIGENYLSYTFTDISAAFFDNAADIFSEQGDRIIFKTFDAEKEPAGQGFVEGTYDLIVANFVLHATAELERTMRNIRKLLKPGGFLVVGESSDFCDHGCFIFGPLPGWWLGYDEGRTLSPNVSPEEWHRILRATGFSGIDAIAPQGFQEILGVSPFVSQAVDGHLNLLREPLSDAPHEVAEPIEKLILIGGRTETSRGLVEQTGRILSQHSAKTHRFATMDEIDFGVIDSTSVVLSLADLDKPVFKDMTPTTFEAFRRLFESQKTILWVTSGRIGDEPWSNIPVGFGRTAENEDSDLQIQHLDIPDLSKASPSLIAETLLRFHHHASHKDEIPWGVEPEIIIDAQGQQLVPRLRPLAVPNARYNSARRPVTQDTDVASCPVEIKHSERGIIVERLWRDFESDTDKLVDLTGLQITHGLLSAVQTPLGHQFLAVGKGGEDGARYIALLPSLVSAPEVSPARVLRCDDIPLSEQTLLANAAAYLVSAAITDNLVGGQVLVVHNPTSMIFAAVAARAAEKHIDVVFTTDSADAGSIPDSWIRIPAYATKKLILKALPRQVSSFVDLSSAKSEVGSAIWSGLPAHCHKTSTASLFSHIGFETRAESDQVLADKLRQIVDFIRSTGDKQLSIPSHSLEELAKGSVPVPDDPLCMVDLTSPARVPAHLSRIDNKPMFKGSKTYWMVGLSGALGISLCDWMIDRGARILVLSSRNPKIESAWIEAHKQNGVRIIIIPCDATNKSALQAVHKTICSDLPPIAGVLNGAMVLNDMSIRNMTYDQLMDVVRPKALGSVHLDDMFYNVKLDFFILFSSINCIIGSTGQANYAGANTFMCSVAAGRRKRGLAATAVNVGAIIGAGYMQRESNKTLDLTVARNSLMKFSEEDFHQLFAEGIEAGQPDSPNGPELSTGLLEVAIDSPNPPKWIRDPKFSYFVVHRKSSAAGQQDKSQSVSIRDLLSDCRTTRDVQNVVEKAFADQLRNELRMSTPDDELMAKRSNDIGLDSLISVDIRNWFLKQFSVSIPVLKILSNDTMANLVQIAVENIPQELTPNVGEIGASTPTTSSSSGKEQESTNASTPTEASVGSKLMDWVAEYSIPGDFDALANKDGLSPVRTPPEVVVLTGVSGLLGHHLLDHLLQTPSVKKVICIAVRQVEQKLQSKKIHKNDRVIYYEGDLALSRLGLSEADAKAIFAEADAVIHNGADTSHLKSYPAMRASNVGSTQELLRLALPRGVPFHYVSSPGAALFSDDEVILPAAPPEGSFPPPDGSHGYMASKWACERLLGLVSDRFGLRVSVHRPSTIIRAGRDAEGTTAQLDWLNALLEYVRVLGKAPRVSHNHGALDLVYVANVCAGVVGQAVGSGKATAGGVTYVHEVGDLVIPLDELNSIDKAEGKVYDVIPMTDWMSQAIKAGLHPGVAALVEDMDTPGMPSYPRLQKGTV